MRHVFLILAPLLLGSADVDLVPFLNVTGSPTTTPGAVINYDVTVSARLPANISAKSIRKSYEEGVRQAFHRLKFSPILKTGGAGRMRVDIHELDFSPASGMATATVHFDVRHGVKAFIKTIKAEYTASAGLQGAKARDQALSAVLGNTISQATNDPALTDVLTLMPCDPAKSGGCTAPPKCAPGETPRWLPVRQQEARQGAGGVRASCIEVR